jgi:ring-1,2-phenylacetyl-CoA epoxidase subunit PaaE
MGEIETTIVDVRPETADAVTLRLDLGGRPFSYRPGQHIRLDPLQFEALRLRLAGRARPACFSISSDALDGGTLEITVKESRGPEPGVSSYFVREARVGERVRISGPFGRYCLPQEPPPGVQGFLHVCAGSGVAPNRGMIRHALARGWPQRHLLILQNRAEEDVLFRDEWEELGARHADRFRVRHVFSRSAGEYVSEELVRREMRGYLDPDASWAFVCGPNVPRGDRPGFTDCWRGSSAPVRAGLLSSLGFRPECILSE